MTLQQLGVDRERLADFCRRWKIQEIALFGSALRDDFGPESDIDLLVTFSPDASWGLLERVRLEDELRELFHREVDLVEKPVIEQSRNWLKRREILDRAETIYDAR